MQPKRLFVAAKGALLVHVQLVVHQDTQDLSQKVYFYLLFCLQQKNIVKGKSGIWFLSLGN